MRLTFDKLRGLFLPQLNITPTVARARADIEGDKTGARPPFILTRQVLSLTTAWGTGVTGNSPAGAPGPWRVVLDGDILFTDSDSTGKIYVRIGNPQAPLLPMPANTVIRGFPINEVYIENPTAQSGLISNLWFGYAADFVPPNTQLNTITGNVAVINGGSAPNNYLNVLERGYDYTTQYTSNTNVGANSVENIIAQASNVNGFILWDARYNSANTGGAAVWIAVMLAKASAVAPTTYVDGDVLVSPDTFVGTTANIGRLNNRSVRVASGKRFDRFTNGAETTAQTIAHARYTLL